MPFRFLDDIAIADVAVEVLEKTLEGLFASAAEALLQIQVEDIDSVHRKLQQTVVVTHEKIDLLLYRFLQELIFLKDSKRLLLRPEEISIEKQEGGYRLKAKLAGEILDPLRHKQGVDVKAVTLHMFEVKQLASGWEATIVFDI